MNGALLVVALNLHAIDATYRRHRRFGRVFNRGLGRRLGRRIHGRLAMDPAVGAAVGAAVGSEVGSAEVTDTVAQVIQCKGVQKFTTLKAHGHDLNSYHLIVCGWWP